MDALLIMVFSFAGYLIMYKVYGHFIGKKIFKLNDNNVVPAVEFEDGVDFVPTKKEVIFGHHFTSIAGTGPIVGPAIAIIWGWVPALLWVFLGSIIMGAVHDFGSLVISLRNQGKSISEFTAKYISGRTKLFFFFIVFLELWIVVSIFGLVMAIIFDMFPGSVFPIWIQIPIAMLLGYMIYNKGGNLTKWSAIAVITMYVTIVIGTYLPLKMPAMFGFSPIAIWSIILLLYAFFASVLPVTKLLQPRDYMNAHQLIVALLLLILGVVFASVGGNLEIVAPAVNPNPAEAPPLWPFLFITIACGAISGFHALVSTGTSSKQIRKESDSLFVGYGSMLLEGTLATLVIIAVSAGIGLGLSDNGEYFTGVQAWTHHYASWAAAKGLGSKVAAFVTGSANLLSAIGIPAQIGAILMGVFVASFAGTTLDSATRIQRYILTEMFPKTFRNRYVSTAAVILLAVVLIFATGSSGKGALLLWPLFGAVNQTLAAMALIIVTVYLRQNHKWGWILSGIPALFMLVISFWAIVLNHIKFGDSDNLLLQGINLVIILSVLWIAVEGFLKFISVKPEQSLEETAANSV